MAIVKPAEILLPDVKNMEKWSVIACDQFTSDPEYWKETELIAGDEPSALKLILPEVYIGTPKAKEMSEQAAENMTEYLENGTFNVLNDSYVYVERELSDGKIRHGIVAEIDLDAYEFAPEEDAPVKATERTVRERLIKRLDLRRSASLELPHVLVFYDDPENKIMSGINSKKKELPKLYSFELMQNGGHIEGRLIQGDTATELSAAFKDLEERAEANAQPERGEYAVTLAVGDGNHSLATAKTAWEEIKNDLSPQERESSKARFALVELVNVYDEGINIEPIHRVIKNTDAREFVRFIKEWFSKFSAGPEQLKITVGTAEASEVISVGGLDTGELVAEADRAIGEYIGIYGGEEDYIHDSSSAMSIGSKMNSAYLLLPSIKRSEIFKTVSQHRIMPKKCFSIGHAREKRYYLEARRIK